MNGKNLRSLCEYVETKVKMTKIWIVEKIVPRVFIESTVQKTPLYVLGKLMDL
jgi:hypothetical protein